MGAHVAAELASKPYSGPDNAPTWTPRVAFCDWHDMKMAMRFIVATFFFALGLPYAWAQSAEDPIVLSIVPIGTPETEMNTDLYADERARLDEVIVNACKDSNRFKAQVSAMDLTGIRIGFDCEDDYSACMANLGKRSKAEQVIWGDLSQRSGQWDLSLQILDVGSRRIMHQETWAFPAADGALEDMALAVRAFVEGKEPPKKVAKGKVRIESDPAGARVVVDGTAYGATPTTLTLDAGPHVVEVSMLDLGTKTRNITVEADGMTRLPPFRFVQDKPEVAVRMAPVQKRSWHFWAGIGVLSVATVSGVGALYFREQQQVAKSDASLLIEEAGGSNARFTAAQQQAYETIKSDFVDARNGIIAFTALTGLAAAGGTYLLFVSDTTTTALVPTLGGLSVYGRF